MPILQKKDCMLSIFGKRDELQELILVEEEVTLSSEPTLYQIAKETNEREGMHLYLSSLLLSPLNHIVGYRGERDVMRDKEAAITHSLTRQEERNGWEKERVRE